MNENKSTQQKTNDYTIVSEVAGYVVPGWVIAFAFVLYVIICMSTAHYYTEAQPNLAQAKQASITAVAQDRYNVEVSKTAAIVIDTCIKRGMVPTVAGLNVNCSLMPVAPVLAPAGK